MARLRRLLMTCLLAAALPLHASGEPTASSRDAAAGGLAFVPDPTIVIETQEIVLSTGEIKINYSLRNKGTAERTIMAVFPLPDLDTAQVSDQQLKVYTTQSANFIAAAITVDGAAARECGDPGKRTALQRVVAGGPLPDLDEDVLEQVFGVRVIVEHFHAQTF